MTTPSSGNIPGTEEPGGLQSKRSQRDGRDLETELTCMHTLISTSSITMGHVLEQRN